MFELCLIVKKLALVHAYVDCREVTDPTSLYRFVLIQLNEQFPSEGAVKSVATMPAFIRALNYFLRFQDEESCLHIIFDGAEQLYHRYNEVVYMLLNLQEATLRRVRFFSEILFLSYS